jgi:hypothetical protein
VLRPGDRRARGRPFALWALGFFDSPDNEIRSAIGHTPATGRPNAAKRIVSFPESVVEIDRDGAKSGNLDRRRRGDASKVRLRFGLLSGESSFIGRAHRDA